ncbi:DUF4212 domain-containing protein [filamentous cyanobacterium LEGE 11480]|uniref:DUF4212 domain-containing protein n=1 Tax=Romeriopsis navalis LEGE 11480 TaxID=2777977 RepID=A0A928VMM1_9CYAN|nr:DUF4212 domain-containing protein [Romeriopsis navalis]MBE9031110.1 DUF4212 domain-containing protein [Romeriopsis navalis LEGE 11480]
MTQNNRPSSGSSHGRSAYWRANTRLIGTLLAIWAIASLVMSILLVEPLNTIKIGQVPFGFWMAQQGSIYVFVVLIFVYAFKMDTLDRRYGGGRNRDGDQ